jgi:hypothetical protein
MFWFKVMNSKKRLYLTFASIVGYLLITLKHTKQSETISYLDLLLVDNQIKSPNYTKNILLFTSFLSSLVRKVKNHGAKIG